MSVCEKIQKIQGVVIQKKTGTDGRMEGELLGPIPTSLWGETKNDKV